MKGLFSYIVYNVYKLVRLTLFSIGTDMDNKNRRQVNMQDPKVTAFGIDLKDKFSIIYNVSFFVILEKIRQIVYKC